MIRQFRLPGNGVRAILLPRPNVSEVAIVVAIHGGSRDDPTSGTRPYRVMKGLHHFAEHVIRRATIVSPTWNTVAKYVNSFSAEYNGFTDKSCTNFLIVTDRRHVKKAIRFLAEVVSNRSVDRATFEVERERVIQEIWTYQDEPSERAENDFDRLLWTRTGFDHQVLGTETSIRSITPSQLRRFIARTYVGRRMVVAVAGGFDPDIVETTLRHSFQKVPAGTSAGNHDVDFQQRRRGLHLRYDATQQLHCFLGWPLPGINDPRRMALGVIRNALTNRDDSARLLLKLDGDAHGYSLTDSFWCYRDVGAYHMYLVLSPDHLTKALRIVTAEIADLQRNLMTAEELELTKQNLAITARSKSSRALAVATFAAIQSINGGRYIPLRTYLSDLRAVTRHQVRRAAQEVLDWRRMMVVIRGPIRGLRRRELSSILRY